MAKLIDDPKVASLVGREVAKALRLGRRRVLNAAKVLVAELKQAA